MQGRNIYRAFEQVIDYQTMYRKLDKVVSTDTEVAARLHKAYEQTTWIDPVLTECFCQVSAIYANLITEVLDLPEQGVYVCNGVGRWIRNPKFESHTPISNEWEVFAIHHRTSETKIVSDVFAFDSRDGSLFEAILGVTFERVSVDDLRHHIEAYAAIDDSISSISNSAESQDQPSANSNSWSCPSSATSCDGSGVKASNTDLQSSRVSVTAEVREIVCNLSGLEPADIQPTSDLVELGIDSLMAMELVREVDTVFHCTLHNEQLLELTDFQSLVACIETTVGHQTEPRSASSTKDDLAIPEDAHRSPQQKAKEVMTESSLRLDPTMVQELWGEVKWTTDDFIVRGLLDKYCSKVMPRSTEACILYILNAFGELGCRIKTAQPEERLDRAIHQPKHQRFVDLIYKLLVDEAGLITIGDAEIIRTDVAIPSQDPESLLDELIRYEPTHAAEHKLLKMVGPYFADCLVGKKDCLQLMFGTPEGRDTVTAMYAKSPITGIWIQQLEHFLKELVGRLSKDGTTLNILEMGAGTGGTTSRIVPMLAALGVPIQYTMTDISGSLVATGRKRFKQYPFVKFEVLDIESEPSVQHVESQHVVLATNCVHATRDLNISLSNIQRILRPDGLLILLEMTEPVPWVDFIFGLVEGWWLFEDDRNYVLQPPSYWERKLHAVGFGHVDWTEGHLPESRLQRLIVANRSGSPHDPLAKSAPQSRPHSPNQPCSAPHSPNQPCSAPTSRQAILDGIISRYKDGFTGPTRCLAPGSQKRPNAQCVLVTGATGSLGSHMVEALMQRSNVSEVVCLNRLSAMDGNLRQQQTFGVRGIRMDHDVIAKMVVIQTDMSKPQLGLSPETFDYLVNNVTSIVHSAWPMSLNRPIRGYEQQFKIFRNLLDLAKEIAHKLPAPMKVGFQFVSSLAVVANYPGVTGDAAVPEQLVTADSVPEGGYAEAKMVCEHLLHETLYRYPDSFSAMAVRVAQISGSTGAGYWSPTEYIAFLVKSSQTLGALPSLEGTLSWYPVDRVAETLSDLLLTDTAAGTSFIGHIDNPARQSWGEMISAFADCLGITTENIIPYPAWVARVRQFAGSVAENPALQLIDFFEQYFVAMSCGQLMLDTVETRSHSTTMQTMKPVEKDLVRKYVGAWKRAGFLK
ncbi:hypothetical protein F4803DRAFT_353224 [Xylaria telfairii]|nr:hypothetical protein F4803DRAFT_353224 [Xylaria telfairii]